MHCDLDDFIFELLQLDQAEKFKRVQCTIEVQEQLLCQNAWRRELPVGKIGPDQLPDLFEVFLFERGICQGFYDHKQGPEPFDLALEPDYHLVQLKLPLESGQLLGQRLQVPFNLIKLERAHHLDPVLVIKLHPGFFLRPQVLQQPETVLERLYLLKVADC